MAQLPPKIPNMPSSNFNSFVFANQKNTASCLPTDTVADQQTWVDDFLDLYTSGKRQSSPSNPSDPDYNYDDQVGTMSTEFHQMKDNQMMSMFMDVDVPQLPSSSLISDLHNVAASTPSDHNSNSNDDEDEDEQIQSDAPTNTVKPAAQNTITDPKRVKRYGIY